MSMSHLLQSCLPFVGHCCEHAIGVAMKDIPRLLCSQRKVYLNTENES